jgi:hypothetical protein
MSTLSTTAVAAAPALDADLTFLLDGLGGAHPGIDLIRDGLRLLAGAELDADRTQIVLYDLVGGESLDILTAVALVVRRLTDSATNPALRTLSSSARQNLRDVGACVDEDIAEFVPRQLVADAIGLIDTARTNR